MKVFLLLLLFLSSEDDIKTLRKYYVKQLIPRTHWSYSIRTYETRRELIKLMRKADISFFLKNKKLPPKLRAIRRRLILELRKREAYQPSQEEYKIQIKPSKPQKYQCPQSPYGIKRYAPEPKVAESPYWADTLKMRNRDVTSEIANLAAQVPPDIRKLMTQPQKTTKKYKRPKRHKHLIKKKTRKIRKRKKSSHYSKKKSGK